MSELNKKIENARLNFAQTDFLTKDEFLKLFQSLRPQYDLDDEEIHDIFDMTDENKEGKIPKESVERILIAVVRTEEMDDRSAESKQSIGNRGSLYVRNDGKFYRGSNQAVYDKDLKQPKKLSSKFLNDLNIDKISEIKHIYSICESGKGFVTLDQIKDFSKNVKQLTCTQEELTELFTFIKDEKKSVITKESFSNLMGELEKTILNLYMDDVTQTSGQGQSFEPTFDDESKRSRIDDSMAPSENGSDDSDDDNDSNLYQSQNDNLVQEVLLIIQKIDEAADGIKNKAKTPTLTAILNEAISISSHFEKKLRNNEEKFKELKQKLVDKKNIEELLHSRIATLEINAKRHEEATESLQNENDALYNTNRALESQIKLYEHIQSDLKEKNNEIVRLERRVKEIDNRKDELMKTVESLESEREMLNQNYKELEQLYRSTESERNAMEQEGAGKGKDNFSSFEVDALKIELKTMLAKKEGLEKDKIGLQEIISELREQLANTKEYIDSLKFEKKDLQSKFDKLQKELEALRGESTPLRSSVMQGSKRASIVGESLAKAIGFQNFDLSSPTFDKFGGHRDLNKIDEEEENNDDVEDFSSRIDILQLHALDKEEKLEHKTQVNENQKIVSESIEEKPDERQFNSLMDTRFSYHPASDDKIFSAFERDSEEGKKKEDDNKVQVSAAAADIDTFGHASPLQKPTKPNVGLDIRNLSQDYLSIRQDPIIIKILQKNNENLNDTMCFSDFMYRINSRENREHRVLFITSETLYCLHPNKNYKVIRKIPLQKIYRITISKSSAGMCAIHVYNDYDYLIDIYKRLNLVLFLQSVFKLKGLKSFSIAYEQSFLVKNRGSTSLKQIDQYSKSVLNPELQSTYKNAQKFGELYLKGGLVFSSWTKFFFVLTDVGLMYFKKAGSAKPIDFIPVIGYLVIDKGDSGDRKFAFKVKFPHSDFEVTLSADSELEKREWIRAIKKIQENAEKQDKEKGKGIKSPGLPEEK